MSKAYDNAKELQYINFDSANNRLNFGLPITSNGANISTDITVYGANSTSNTYFALPTGNLVSRPASPPLGAMRYNTTNSWPEIYTNDGWKAFAAQPYITSVSPTVIAGNSNAVIDIYGANFSVEAQVYFIDNFNNAYLANTVTYYSNTRISAPTPRDFTIGVEPLDVRVVQNSGIFTLENAIDCGTVPTWVTTAGSLGSIFGANTVNVYVSATDAEGSVVTYSLTSGGLPIGLSLSSNGLVQGVATGVQATTTYNFTIKASDVVTNNVDRAFSYQILNRVPVFNTAPTLSNITDSMLDNYSANVSVNAYDPDGGVITYALTVGSVPTGFTFNTSNGALQLTDANTAEVTTNTTSTFTVSATDVGSGVETRQFNITIQHPIDADFSNTVLLLSAADSNTIIKDASSNNLNLVVFGDSRATNFSPYNTSWSNLFDGSGDTLTLSTSSDFNLGTNNWTLEFWLYLNGIGGSNYNHFFTINTQDTFAFKADNSVYYVYGNSGGGSTTLLTGGAPVYRQWHHLALVRNGTSLTLYKDGVQYGAVSTISSGATFGATSTVTIGGSSNVPNEALNGYISNMRLVKGTALYTSNTSISTTPLANVTNTVLLTCHTNRFVNQVNTSMTLTVGGDTKVVGWSPFAETDTSNGSMYFDGTGDYVQMMTPYNFGTNNFTIEGWFYLTNISSASLWGASNGGGQIPKLQAYISTGTLGIDLNGISVISVTASSYLKAYSWNHMALCRGGTSTNQSALFINGVRAGTGTIGSQTGVTTNFGIGYMELGAITASYISDFRIIDGTDVYGYTNTTYTVPTTPLANIANTKLLTLQNRQSHNNHGFQDNSNNKFLITRNGNTTQGTFTPFSSDSGKWSNYLDGTGDYLTGPTGNSAFNLSSGPWTIEAWVFHQATTTGQGGVISNMRTDAVYGWVLDIGVSTDGLLSFSNYNNSVNSFVSSGSNLVPKNTWAHICAMSNGTTVYLFINGVQVGSGNITPTVDASSIMQIGRWAYTTPRAFIGHISNLRVVKGTAVYNTSGFTVPSSPIESVANTQLLTCQSNRFVDISPNAFALTTSGDIKVQPFSPFAPNSVYTTANTGGSAYFDGSGDYLVVNSGSTYLPIGANDFTIELWWYPTSFPSGAELFSAAAGDGTGRVFAMYAYNSNGTLGAFAGTGGSTWDIVNNLNMGTAILNQWNHMAFTRSGSTFSTFLNRTRIATTTATGTLGSKNIGVGGSYAGLSIVSACYISNPRLIVGNALYTASTYTLPTLPFKNIANTVVLLSFTDAAIEDFTGKNIVETVNDAKANNIITKFAPGAFSFDGNGDYLYAIQNGSNLFLTGDFTIEAWIRFNTVGNGQIISAGPGNVTNAYYWQYFSSQLQFGNQGGANIAATNWTPNANQWYHVSVCRSGTSVRQFVDGVQLGSTITSSQSFVDGPTYVGYGGAGYFNGTITDLRVTKSARYTANFTPRPRKLPRR